jgi:hypothetical protein
VTLTHPFLRRAQELCAAITVNRRFSREENVQFLEQLVPLVELLKAALRTSTRRYLNDGPEKLCGDVYPAEAVRVMCWGGRGTWNLCFRAAVDDLECEYFASEESRWAGGEDDNGQPVALTLAEQRQLLASRLRGGAMCYAFPSISDYPGISGGHNALEEVTARGKKPIAALVQLRMTELSKAVLEASLAAMHAEAERLGLQRGEYAAILYTASLPDGAVLPRGTLVVCRGAVEALVAPLGRESVMSMMLAAASGHSA